MTPRHRTGRRAPPPAEPGTGRARDAELARRGRVVALVIAAAGLAAILAPWIVAVLGLPLRYEMLIYFAALAAFVWSLVVIYQMWRARRD